MNKDSNKNTPGFNRIDLDIAMRVVHLWGTYMEYAHGKFHAIFLNKIPESCLPFPKQVLEDAINTVAGHYHYQGEKDKVELLQNSQALLMVYKDDDEALLNAKEILNDLEFRDVVSAGLKIVHKDWIEAQKDIKDKL